MRVPVREQICLLMGTTSLLAVAVLSLATWLYSGSFVKDVRSSSLSLAANLKAAQVGEILQLYYDSVQSIGTRVLLQRALQEYNEGNRSQDLIDEISADLAGALSGGGRRALLLQSTIYPRRNVFPEDLNGILNVTGDWINGRLKLPYDYSNGSWVYLGDPGLGYPPQLYPNLTYVEGPDNKVQVSYDNATLLQSSVLVLGPLYLNNDSSLISITTAITNENNTEDTLGWMTIVVDARLLYGVVSAKAGLGSTGEVLIVGPATSDNLFVRNVAESSTSQNANVDVRFVLPPPILDNRHSLRTMRTGSTGNPDLPFKMSAYPAVLSVWSQTTDHINNAGARLSTHNEEGRSVSVGYARIDYPSVDWVLIFEQSHHEVMEPIVHFREISLACIFSVFGLVILASFPIAHYSVRPIRELRIATENSISPYQDDDSGTYRIERRKQIPAVARLWTQIKRAKLFNRSARQEPKNDEKAPSQAISHERVFRIPQKVPQRRHLFHDELTELTETFNEMSDELFVQYSKLEERIKIRTAELEQSRNAAQAANDSKTLFVANISHELRTPLNGILGMCAAALHEKEPVGIHQTLKIIYKSGNLLLRLLNDLLTFSRNSFGRDLVIDDQPFRLEDIGVLITSIFEQQARDAHIDLKVVYLSDTQHLQAPEEIPAGGVRKMSLRGDKNRLLQILMNLVGNSLKFTPAHGVVEVRIKYLGFVKPHGRRKSVFEESPKDSIKLSFQFEVEDTGSGIPEHLQEDIFKPFVQGDLALSKKHGGTGLGLAICSQLADLMGGQIKVKSIIDIGSTFTLSIPLGYSRERAASISASFDEALSASNIANSENVSVAGSENRSARRRSRREKSVRDSEATPRQSPSTEVPPLVSSSTLYVMDSESLSPPSSLDAKENASSRQTPKWNEKGSLAPLPSGGPSGRLGPPTKDPNTTNADTCRPTRVLVAEDNKVNQEVVKRMLKFENITDFTIAQDGKEALDRVRETMEPSSPDAFSLILMDIQMPNMDGIESTRHIRDLGYKAPIVALTAFTDDSNRTACTEAGMNGFLPKPLKRSALKSVLQEFLGPPVPKR